MSNGCGNDGGDFSSHMLEHEMGGMFDVGFRFFCVMNERNL